VNSLSNGRGKQSLVSMDFMHLPAFIRRLIYINSHLRRIVIGYFTAAGCIYRSLEAVWPSVRSTPLAWRAG